MFKNLIWDFDGTLFDTYPAMVDAFKKALKDRGIEETEENILDFMKISFSDALKHFTEVYKLDNNFVEDYKVYENNSDLDKIVPFPYAKEICEEFVKSGGRNFIFTHREKKTALRILEFHNMKELFKEAVTKDNGFKRKPDVEGFLYLVDRYGMNKKETLVVGDRDIEITGAKNSGVKSCLYNTNNAEISVEPDFVVQSLKGLEKIIF
jgi:HAD superfamily hydrolase (TIGR01549 family)